MSIIQDPSCPLDDVAVGYEMSLKTAQLEREYGNAIGHTARILDAEKIRSQRMEQLFLRFENDELRVQLDQANGLVKTKNEESHTQIQLREARKEIKKLQAIIQTLSSEVEILHKENASLNGDATEHEKTLAEKTRLSKDLSSVLSEFERLKTQNASYQSHFSAKQGLEKQLKTAEVQAENERHAHECTKIGLSRQVDVITDLSGKLGKAQEEVIEELRVREMQQRDTENQRLEWESERAAYEDKLQCYKKGLHSAKEHVQETKREFQVGRGNGATDITNDTDSRSRNIPLQRAETQANTGMTIATPGAIEVREKAKKSAALPGDKSAFSITPFLNRTGAPPGSPIVSEDEMDKLAGVTSHDESGTSSSRAGFLEGNYIECQPHEESFPVQDSRRHRRKQRAPKSRIISPALSERETPSKPSEHIVNEEQPMVLDALQKPFSGQMPAKTKRRRLGVQRNKGMLNDENDELLEARQPARKQAIPGTLQPSTSSIDRPQNRAFVASTGFSPLKRDKRRP